MTLDPRVVGSPWLRAWDIGSLGSLRLGVLAARGPFGWGYPPFGVLAAWGPLGPRSPRCLVLAVWGPRGLGSPRLGVPAVWVPAERRGVLAFSRVAMLSSFRQLSESYGNRKVLIYPHFNRPHKHIIEQSFAVFRGLGAFPGRARRSPDWSRPSFV